MHLQAKRQTSSQCLVFGNSKFSAKFDNTEILSSFIEYILATRELDVPVL